MYNYDDVGSSYISLPPNLQTVENECFLYALDKQIAKLHRIALKLTVWSDLDHVDSKYYDFLAICLQAPFYKPEYSNEQKLELIKTAIMSHRFAGTRSAIDQLIGIVFADADFVPWDEYGGKPYHFIINVSDVMTEDAAILFTDILKKVKAARSIMDKISINRKSSGSIYVGTAQSVSYKSAVIRD